MALEAPRVIVEGTHPPAVPQESGPVALRPRKRVLDQRLAIDLSMLGLAVASLGLVLYEIVGDAELSESERMIFDYVDLAIVLVFLSEFLWSARKSGDMFDYAKRNWYDLPSMIWLPGNLVQGFVSLRLLRLVRLVRVMRTLSRIRRISQHAQIGVLQDRLLYIAVIAVATVVFGAISFFVVEKGANANVQDLGDAVWWSIVTTATVGYGDVVPITMEGRLVATVLMVVGVGIIGTLAGTLAQSFLFRREAQRKRRIHSRWHGVGQEEQA